MLHRLLFILLTFICVNSAAQSVKMCNCNGFEVLRDTINWEGQKEEEPCYFSEKSPKFPGGDLKLNKFCRQNSSYKILDNKDLSNEGEFERVFVCLIIDKFGTVIEKKIRTPNELYKTDVLKIISKMPKWIPAMQSKRPVIGRYTFEIKYIK
jgi:hypothetical protein